MATAVRVGFELLTAAGGVALILFGAAYLRKALDHLFGTRLEGWIRAMAASPLRAVASGLGVSLLAPSSTTMASLAVHTVQAGQATATQMLALMLGAGIGLTATIQLVALNLAHYAPVIVLGGFVLSRSRSTPRARQVGRLILGLGFIFLGILTAQQVLTSPDGSPLSGSSWLDRAVRHPWSLAAIGLVVSLLTQSATATIALALALVQAQRIALSGAIAWVVGANLGIGATVLIGGWRRMASRRLGIAFLLAQAAAALLVALWPEQTTQLLLAIPEPPSHAVANAHTAFNVLAALIGLVCLQPFDRVGAALAPARWDVAGTRYALGTLSGEPPESFALGLAQARREMLRAGGLFADDLEAACRGIAALDGSATAAVRADRAAADRLVQTLASFLGRLSSQEGQDTELGSQPMLLARLLADLEVVYHVASTNLATLGRHLQEGPVRFSADGALELDAYAREVCTALRALLAAFAARDAAAARSLQQACARLAERAQELRDRHLARLQRGLAASVETSIMHLDVLTFLQVAADHIGGAAASVAALGS